MLSLGHNNVGKYNLWVTSSNIDDKDISISDKNYFLVLVTKNGNVSEKMYVNLMKSEHFNFLFNVDKNYRPVEGKCDMVQYNYYLQSKDMQQPLYLLSKENVELLIKKFSELSV